MKTVLILFIWAVSYAQTHAHEEKELHIQPHLLKEFGITFTSLKDVTPSYPDLFFGEIIPSINGSSVVSSLVSGKITQIYVTIGQSVKKGDVLFQVSSLKIMELMDEYFSAEIDLFQAESDLKRLQNLQKKGLESEKELFDATSRYTKAKAEFGWADKKIHAVGFTDEEILKIKESPEHLSTYGFVKAPMDGMITDISMEKGRSVSEETPLAHLINPKHLWVKLLVYEDQRNLFSVGERIDISSSLVENMHSTATIIRVNQRVSENNSVEIIASLSSFNGFIVGSKVEAKKRDEKQETYKNMLPIESVMEGHDGAYVFVYLGEGEFQKKHVVLGKKTESFVQVLSGVELSETVVKDGTFYLKSLENSEQIGGHSH